MSNGANLTPNFGIVICVYNWDVSCENSICPAGVYRPFITNHACRNVSAINLAFLRYLTTDEDGYGVFNPELICGSSGITYFIQIRRGIVKQLEINGNCISARHVCLTLNRGSKFNNRTFEIKMKNIPYLSVLKVLQNIKHITLSRF